MATNASPMGFSYAGDNGGMDEATWNSITQGLSGQQRATDGQQWVNINGQDWAPTYSATFNRGSADTPDFDYSLKGYAKKLDNDNSAVYNADGTFSHNYYSDPNADVKGIATIAALAAGGYGLDAAGYGQGATALTGAAEGGGAGLMQLGSGAVPLGETAMTGLMEPVAGAASGSGWGGLGGLFEKGLTLKQGLGGAASLYDIWSRNQMANAQRSQMEASQNQTNNLYAPGSPEYNLLAEKIARSNAASGRNSQVGQFASTLAGTIAEAKLRAGQGALAQQNSLLNSSLQNRYGGIGSLFFNIANLAGK